MPLSVHRRLPPAVMFQLITSRFPSACNINDSSTQQQQTTAPSTAPPTKLDMLPAEILCNVAHHLPKSSVRALRLTNRAIEAGTFNAFTDNRFKEFDQRITISCLRKWSEIYDNNKITASVRTLKIHFTELCRKEEDDDKTLQDLCIEVLSKLPNIRALEIYGSIFSSMDKSTHAFEDPVEVFLQAFLKQKYAVTKLRVDYTSIKSSTLATFFQQAHHSLDSVDMVDFICCGEPFRQILPVLRDALRLINVHFHRLRDEATSPKFVFWSQRRVVRAVRNPHRQIKIINREDPSKSTTTAAIEYYTTDKHDARIEGHEVVAKGIESFVKHTLEDLRD